MYVSLMERRGIEKGIEQGIVQGIEKGILRGKTEMIREMLRWGDSDEKILACARITPEELAALKAKAGAKKLEEMTAEELMRVDPATDPQLKAAMEKLLEMTGQK